MLPLPGNPLNVPLGCSLNEKGATFRIWAPRAQRVLLTGDFNKWQINNASSLQALGDGTWCGFVSGMSQNQKFLYHIDGPGGAGLKRDPRARLLTTDPPFPQSRCVVRNPAAFPWHDTGYHTPDFNNLILYQLHIGTYRIRNGNVGGKFLDVIGQIPYLQSLGINALQLMPVVEFPTQFSLGYNGSDYYSPENDYGEADAADVEAYFQIADRLLRAKGTAPYGTSRVLTSIDDQLRALVDIAHVYGIGVLLDVVYNHAGGGFDPQSLYFLDQMTQGNNNDSLYFTDQGWAGGLVFAYWNRNVRQFLIDNATSFYEEYRIDGFRFDEVSVMDAHGGWGTCQEITATCRSIRPEAILIAEYWPVNPAVVAPIASAGAGFDATWQDDLRDAVRNAVASASGGATAFVDMGRIADAVQSSSLANLWRGVQCIENHDIVYHGRGERIPRLADPADPRSWYARSRSRVASGLLLTAPGIPMLFMGQEFLEDKQFSDDPASGDLIWWAGLEGADKAMSDHLRFTSDLIRIRWRHPALRGEPVRAHYINNPDRILAFHRWLEGTGRDVIVVASLQEATIQNYRIGFPAAGQWLEVFNSDVYDNWVNPHVAGNSGSVWADLVPLHGMPASASLTIPANSILVFARDSGD